MSRIWGSKQVFSSRDKDERALFIAFAWVFGVKIEVGDSDKDQETTNSSRTFSSSDVEFELMREFGCNWKLVVVGHVLRRGPAGVEFQGDPHLRTFKGETGGERAKK